MEKIAVVLFNLGGPDSPEAVEPFLFNLFNDPAIIALPQPLRWGLAKLISRRRAPVAQEIYQALDGRSPLLANTEAQAEALAVRLNEHGGETTFRCFPAMRYWHPMSPAAATAVRDWDPDKVVLLPLYPQYSTTTTGSSVSAWTVAAREVGLEAETTGVCCYAEDVGLVTALAARARTALEVAGGREAARLLFSAHGLPKKVIAAGDPYQWQIERTASAVVDRLGRDGLDWRICYQSRVGPLEWLRPYTEHEIRRAGEEGRALAVVPVAFVSEHSETLVELDIEYRELAESVGVPTYVRAPTVSTDETFIDGLARLVEAALPCGSGLVTEGGGRRCPARCTRCPVTGG